MHKKSTIAFDYSPLGETHGGRVKPSAVNSRMHPDKPPPSTTTTAKGEELEISTGERAH